MYLNYTFIIQDKESLYLDNERVKTNRKKFFKRIKVGIIIGLVINKTTNTLIEFEHGESKVQDLILLLQLEKNQRINFSNPLHLIDTVNQDNIFRTDQSITLRQ